MLVNQPLSHLKQHQANRHAVGNHIVAQPASCKHIVAVFGGMLTKIVRPLYALFLQHRKHHLAPHQANQMGHLMNSAFLIVSKRKVDLIEVISIVMHFRNGSSRQQTVGEVRHQFIQRLRLTTHYHRPLQASDMHVSRLKAFCLPFVGASVIGKSEHCRKLVCAVPTPLCQRDVYLWRK